MATVSIPRMKFRTDENALADARVTLANEANTILGYTKLAEALSMPGALLFALASAQR